MYFPFVRGKQFELLMLRENAALMAEHDICPIIEPVNSRVSSLQRALKELDEAGATYAVIANPTVGDFAAEGADGLNAFLDEHREEAVGFITAVSLHADTNTGDLAPFADLERCMFVHLAQLDSKETMDQVGGFGAGHHVFAEEQCGKLYRRKFTDADSSRVLLKDGFKQRRNADYEEHEHFSDLHATFREEEGMDGFGDHLIVGREFQDGGGPAYAVVIHITYIDDDDDMQICHFVSKDNNSPVDPGGKFLQAVSRLVEALDEGRYSIRETKAIKEFRALHRKQHYPGLGYIKKLSMQHHVETIANYLNGV